MSEEGLSEGDFQQIADVRNFTVLPRINAGSRYCYMVLKPKNKVVTLSRVSRIISFINILCNPLDQYSAVSFYPLPRLRFSTSFPRFGERKSLTTSFQFVYSRSKRTCGKRWSQTPLLNLLNVFLNLNP